jgi:uroporphyrinogen decarboxylase
MKPILKSRERVLRALNHQEVDRIPIDLGGTHNSSMCTIAYENFKKFLGVEVPTEILNLALENARMDEAVLSRLPSDVRLVAAKPPKDTKMHWLDPQTFVDDWGITYHQPDGWPQFDMVAHPLAQATIAELDHYDWPKVEDEARFAGLRDSAKDLHEHTDYAVCGATMDSTIFDKAWALRGMQQFLTDLLADPGFALALLEKVTQLQCKRYECFLKQVGKYIDVIVIGDDMGVQKGPLIRPQLYRQMIKPFHKRLINVIRQNTDAKIHNHACGSIVELVEDYIELGIDVLNPMQVSATNMSPQNLKQRFSGRMAFWGGIDTQALLPHGQPEEIRQSVRETIQAMDGLGGGYVLGAVHNVQDDVPPENVWAMLDEAAKFSSVAQAVGEN